MSDNWQRRWQPLLQQWVVIAANSAERPWSGAMSAASTNNTPVHDPSCYLCPGVKRASGQSNPDYKGAYAFDNDFPTLAANAPVPAASSHPLRQTAAASGRCRVLCWSERHDATLASLSEAEMVSVARLWQQEYRQLSAMDSIAQVLIFENKGVEIGVSNLHPHGQVYATGYVTDTATRMRDAQAEYARAPANAKHGASLLQDMLLDEYVQENLLVEKKRYWSVIVPFAARFSYETWIVPHRRVASIAGLDEAELSELAIVYQRQVKRYDILFQRSAPNITLLHNAPCDDHKDNRHWCFHLAFHPPLRDAQKMKYLAGFESGSNNIVNPLLPENAASILSSIAREQRA